MCRTATAGAPTFLPREKWAKACKLKLDQRGNGFGNIPAKLRLVASLILYSVQYGIIDTGSAGRLSPRKSGVSMFRLIITDYFQLTLEKSQ